MRLFFFIAIIIIATPCISLSKQIRDNKTGWIHGNCLGIKNSNLTPFTQFTLVNLDNKNSIEKAVVLKKVFDKKECFPLLDDRADINKSAGYIFYLIKSNKPINLAIGVFESEKLPISELTFSSCNTTEGIQFFISNKDSLLWKGYYYLGYELEPTCKE